MIDQRCMICMLVGAILCCSITSSCNSMAMSMTSGINTRLERSGGAGGPGINNDDDNDDDN